MRNVIQEIQNSINEEVHFNFWIKDTTDTQNSSYYKVPMYE